MSQHASKITRRGFLALAAAAPLAACSPEQSAGAASLFNGLEAFPLRGQNGEEKGKGDKVNMRALKAAQGNSFATLSFGFNSCSEYCPFTVKVLADLQKKHPDMIHYVVNVSPELDGARQAERDAYMATFRKVGMDTSKIVLLYPEKGEIAPQIAHKLNLIANSDKATDHSSMVVLYGPDGKERDRISGLDEMKKFERWDGIINAAGPQR